jgi:hypothetical protein
MRCDCSVVIGNYLPTFWDNLYVTIWRVKQYFMRVPKKNTDEYLKSAIPSVSQYIASFIHIVGTNF